jgi:hypothetical protein
MGKETFLLLFVSGCAALATWIVVCRPKLAPTSFRAGTVHLVAAFAVGALLGPLEHAVPGLPSRVSILAALFFVALPAITYMLLVGMWLIQLAVANAAPGRR